ncbi:hypothetical protein CGMCC3_g12524 [Colletotrichum fructicola]|nr:uncharacterized protein CGMCC3_g12524 [Colletotrichum fructicola]KAE9571324.1 hypothetical protein CGMCC3_g12524 [Colletotrichum fructicola]
MLLRVFLASLTDGGYGLLVLHPNPVNACSNQSWTGQCNQVSCSCLRGMVSH